MVIKSTGAFHRIVISFRLYLNLNKMIRLTVPFWLLYLLVFPSIAQTPPEQIHLWPNGAPGFEDRKNEPEEAKDWWVKNIHNPSITAFLPKNPNGTAVLICPGGGHRTLVYNAEGSDAAEFFNKLGITAFVLKYRLAREEGSPYDLNVHPKQDAMRAMRLIRSRADEWNIDPDKLGIMGFSAGGEVVASVAYGDGNGAPGAEDPVDRQNAKPSFQILIYPGPLWIPEELPENAPLAFMVAAINDQCCAAPIISLLQKYHASGQSVEAHIYAHGDHAFNMGYRTELKTIKGWPERLEDWLYDSKLIDKK